MQDGFKIAISAGLMGAVVGLGMQGMSDQMSQTIGQGWMLGGLAGSAVLGGIAAISEKWTHFKREREINQNIDELQKKVDNLSEVKDVVRTMTEFTRLAGVVHDNFDSSREKSRATVVLRLQILGLSIADKMPTPELADHAASSVYRTMGNVSFRLGQSLDQDKPVSKAGIDIDITAPAAPSMG